MMAATIVQIKPTFSSAYSQKSLLISTVVYEHVLSNEKELPPYEAFHSKLRNCNLL